MNRSYKNKIKKSKNNYNNKNGELLIIKWPKQKYFDENNNNKEITIDDIFNKALKDTKNNNNISLLEPWAVTLNLTICYIKNYGMAFTFSFEPKGLTIRSNDMRLTKSFYYTDERVLNLLLTITLSDDEYSIKDFNDLKQKIILSLL